MKLFHKLFVSNVVIIILLVISAFVVNTLINQRVLRNVFEDIDKDAVARIAQGVAQEYAHEGNLDSLVDNPRAWQQLAEQQFHSSRAQFSKNNDEFNDFELTPPNEPPKRHPSFDPSRHSDFDPPQGDDPFIPFDRRITLVDSQGRVLIESDSIEGIAVRQDVILNNTVIATLKLHRNDNNKAKLASRYIRNQAVNGAWVLVFGLIIAIVVSYVLARHFTRPIVQLTHGAKALAKRDFDTHITVSSNDEFASLANSFNNIATELKRFEQTQSQWIMDISHELRTPLTILEGELSAIADGVSPFDDAAVRSLQEEVTMLSALVNDLHQLTKTEGQLLKLLKETVNLTTLVIGQAEKYRSILSTRGISLQLNVPEVEICVHVDKGKIIQVIKNLFENCVRYSQEQGQVFVNVGVQQGQVMVSIEDSGPGVDSMLYDKLFDRLFRADASRNRKSGGFGLGLAICKNIITAHQGRIYATKSVHGGLCIQFTLPVSKG
ncbi:ATP-binding protein [Pseudoalteromonas sp. GB56]